MTRNALRRDNYKKLFANSPKFLIKDCIECSEKDKRHRRCEVSSGGSIQYRSVCIDCWRKKEQTYRKANWDKIKQKKVERAQSAKRKCVEYLGGQCCKCGYNKSMRALTFHHKIRSDKSYEITAIKDHNWEKVKAELDKCILICFNCHMEEEEIRDANKESNK